MIPEIKECTAQSCRDGVIRAYQSLTSRLRACLSACWVLTPLAHLWALLPPSTANLSSHTRQYTVRMQYPREPTWPSIHLCVM